MAAGLLCIRLSPIYAFEAEEIAELRGGRAGVALAAAKNLSVPTDETSLLPRRRCRCRMVWVFGCHSIYASGSDSIPLIEFNF